MFDAQHVRLRIALLSGGDSAEREISLESGSGVAAALEEAGHDVERFDPAEIDLRHVPWHRFDACFLALHGGSGEDGRVQTELERLQVAYTGSGPAASRLAMSKSASKERFLQAGVPTLPYVLLEAGESLQAIAGRTAPLGYPLVLKPDSQGSSLGVVRVGGVEELEAGLAASAGYDQFIVAEPLLRGREFTVAVLGRRPLPILEIIAPGGLFDYEAKYEQVTTEYRFDSRLPPGVRRTIEQAAVGAAECLGTAGLVRVDLMLDDAGRPSVLEVNTIPGMTAQSLAPKAAAEAGLSIAQLCDWIVRDCLAAEARR